ncbi:MAG TPA: DUF4337 domain-containing protein [Holophagaceae bacterium]|nr:DUF4337 domain-containing protein [Holophagaceae bacterium]
MPEALDPIQDTVQEHGGDSRLNTIIAALVALTATFMALCNVKDGNVVQAMQQAQAGAVDQWSYYQAKSTKQHIAENTAELLEIQKATTPSLKPEVEQLLDGKIRHYQEQAKKYEGEKLEIQKQAKDLEDEYNALNTHDDQFDLAEACLTVSIALFGVTALTRKRWLLLLGLTFCGIGFLMGVAGFFHLSLHSDLLARVLG